MSTYYQRIILVLIAGFFLTGMANKAFAKKPLFEDYKQVIVIDPGHGGEDSGARGSDGTTEKTITLNLARILATELQREYKVVLTRTDDNQANLEKRTALSNHHKADLLISLHTGGSLVHSTSGIFIYHYQDFAGNPPKRYENKLSRGRDKTAPILWDQAQSRHLKKSRVLARLINRRLNNANSDKESRVQGAPLLLLQGANMPAILIEIGYLSNAAEEKQLIDQNYLTDLAQKIRRGIDEYFKQQQ
jgi:N-acetylmuramoyl-L-alanine amidase